MDYPFRANFLPYPTPRLEKLVGPNKDLTAYKEAWERDWAYTLPLTNFDESKAGALPLPSILVDSDTNIAISTQAEWPNLRKKHLENITKILYGELPPKPQSRETELILEKEVFNGTCIKRILKHTLVNNGKRHEITVMCFIPKRKAPVPAFVAMNFPGNHGCLDDDDVPLSNWRDQNGTRGNGKNRWPFRMLSDKGFAVITCSRYDFYPDDIIGREESVFRLFHDADELKPTDRRFTAISAWAYGYSILRELASSFPEIDEKQIWAHGHSRLGKTALWAIANDQQFAGAISNCSGCAGAKISRRNFGETLEVIDHYLSWWFTDEAAKYASRPETLPFDQHTLIALAAPKPVLVTGAREDEWADNHGQFLAVKAAQEIYRFLGLPTLPSQEHPQLCELLMCPSLGFVERYGYHDVTDEDWRNTISFVNQNRF